MKTKEILEQLQEIRKEITRVNQAAGETVFNPSATSALESVLKALSTKKIGP